MLKVTHKIIHWFIIVNAIIILGGGLLITWLAFFEGNGVATFPDAPLKTVQPQFDKNGDYVPKGTFTTGEHLTYALEFCKKLPIPAEVYGYYIDTVKIAMPVLVINTPTGCHRTISSTFKIPKILPTGIYHFEVEVRYQVNPIRTVIVKYRTEEFKIVNNDLTGNI